MSDERPLGLNELARYDSPEVVRAALGRFRRRLLIRGLLIPVIIAAVVFVPKLFPGIGHAPYLQFERTNMREDITAPEITVGPVRFQPIDARRLDEDPLFGVRLLVTTDALRGNERLSIEEGVTGITHACEPIGGFSATGEPSAGVQVFTRGGKDILEVIVICPLDSKRVVLQIGALAGPEGRAIPHGHMPGGDAAPGSGATTQAECAVPLNELGSCAMTKKEGTYRPLGTLTLDFELLRIAPGIWRSKS